MERIHESPRTLAIALGAVLTTLVLLTSWVTTSSKAEAEPIEPLVPVGLPEVKKPEPQKLRGDESIRTSRATRAKRGEYAGPLIQIDRVGACPKVARAFFKMRASAARQPVPVPLKVTSGFRTHRHQARLYRQLGPQWAARPGTSRHHDATELDIKMRPGGNDRIHKWLRAHAGKFGFVQRYSWESWHWGYVRGC